MPRPHFSESTLRSSNAQLFTLLMTASPLLIVYIGGLIASLMMWNRHRKPAVLTFAGVACLLFTTVLQPFTTMWVVRNYTGGTVNGLELTTVLMIINVVIATLRAGGYILLLVAVFTGRPYAENDEGGFPMASSLPPALPLPSERVD